MKTKTTLSLCTDVTKGQKHIAVKTDVSLVESVVHLSSAIYNAYNKPPSVVIHCAGILGTVIAAEKMTEEMWQTVIDCHLKGTFLINQTFAKLMKSNGIAGSIINLSSVVKDGMANQLAYCAAKAGIGGLTKTMAQEFGPYNIRCNAVAPGSIPTPLQSGSLVSSVKTYVDNCAMKRVGQPEEVASVCVFLGSDASSYVNGIVMKVHGGRIIC